MQKNKIMASGRITSWQIEREKVEAVTDFIFFGSKITADGDCSYEIKRHLLLRRKVMTNLDTVLKSRDITLLTKVHMAFPVVIYGFESWTIKKTKHQNWCFWMVVLEETLESSLNSKKIKLVNPEGNQFPTD